MKLNLTLQFIFFKIEILCFLQKFHKEFENLIFLTNDKERIFFEILTSFSLFFFCVTYQGFALFDC